MAHISINKQYIVAGDSFVLTLDDYQGSPETVHDYKISGTGITAADHFVGESSQVDGQITGTFTLGSGTRITKEFTTTSTFPTGEDFIPITISLTSSSSNNITLRVYSPNHFTRIDNDDKVDLGDTFDQWRKKTNGFIARLDTLENKIYQYKQQTIVATGYLNAYALDFDIDTDLAAWFDVHIDGIAQNPTFAYTINKVSNSIIFDEQPPLGASISIVHKADITMTSFDLTNDLADKGWITQQVQIVGVDNKIKEGHIFFKEADQT